MIASDVIARADGFVYAIKSHPVQYGTCALARFDVAAYDASLFDRFGIELPVSLSKAVAKRRADFLAGRLIATVAMGRNVPVPIGRDRGPVWPDGKNGSITHGHGRCAAIFADDSVLCGIDLEKTADGSGLEAILQKCLSRREHALIAAQKHVAPHEAATLVFSAKETIYKALSSTVGRFFGFECAEVVSFDAGGIMTMRLCETLHYCLPKGLEIPVSFEMSGGFALTHLQVQRKDLGL